MKTTIGELVKELGGDSIAPELGGREITELLTDSRSLLDAEKTVFFAIPTRTNDGSRYMRAMYDRGVRVFVSPRVPEGMKDIKDAVIIECADPVAALQKVAARRGNLRGDVVAITGSKGKTTLKEWLFQLLEPMKEIARSPRSYNSQIGVPLSMWEIGEGTELALIEAGISKAGEMKALAECIRPDDVIITDLGDEHAEGFSSYEQKVEEKVSLAAAPGVKRVFYSKDIPGLQEALDKQNIPGRRQISWSMKPDMEADLNITETDWNEGKCRIAYRYKKPDSAAEESAIEAVLTGEADLRNACYALLFMLDEGYSPEVIAGRFASLHPITTRLSVSDGGNGCNIIYDSYASDFSSLLPALDFMVRRKVPGQQTVAILSDLRHEAGGDEYVKIADLIRRRGLDRFIGVGKNLKEHASHFPEDSLFFDDTASLAQYLRENPLKDSIVLLKGAPEFNFVEIKELLEERTHETLLEVNLDALIRNYNYFKSHLSTETGMVAMVKASGYGAGSYEIAKTLQDAGAAYLAVAVLDEGLDLRRRGITMPIMVMNPRVADYREMFAHNLEPEIYTRRMLDDVIAQARLYNVEQFPIHIKLDTGMHRMGFIESELPELMEAISKQNNVRISSVFSHLATADEPTMNDYTEFQLENFERCSSYMLAHSSYPFRRHVLNSAGILRYSEKYHYDMARLGIGLYGVNTLPVEMEKPLSVVSSLKTVIINLREWPEGTTIGYGRRGKLSRPSKVATIPIGYADGMNRKFGNGAIKVLVNGQEAPTIGNICMDACMIDVTGIDCREGDTVEIFGENMGVQRLADVIGTIPYEVLTSVSPRVKRVYFRE